MFGITSVPPQMIPGYGVAVVVRWPGFPAYRMLRDGDLILGLYLDRAAPLDQLPNCYTCSFRDLQLALAQQPLVRDVELSVLRDGRVIRVPITLARRPAAATIDGFLQDRLYLAADYWRATFGPVVDADDPAPGATAAADR